MTLLQLEENRSFKVEIRSRKLKIQDSNADYRLLLSSGADGGGEHEQHDGHERCV